MCVYIYIYICVHACKFLAINRIFKFVNIILILKINIFVKN